MGGFSYRGKDIGDFGEVYYIPDETARGEYALPYEVSEQEVPGRDGAYYYGNRVEPREFEQRCYYEGLTQQDKEDIMHWFGRNTKGRLVFEDRKYAYYDVIPNQRVRFEDYRGMTCQGLRYQGILTIYLKAYRPFAKMDPDAMVNNVPMVGFAVVDVSLLGEATTDGDNETIILYGGRMPSREYAPSGSPFYIYNMGTERTPLKIRIAGDAENGLITNTTNGQTCAIKGMTRGNTTDVGKYVEIDTETGRVTLVGVLGSELAFEMHDYGYIWLEPSVPFEREIEATYESGSKNVTSDADFYPELAGQYIYLNNAWREIESYGGKHTLVLKEAMDATGTETTQILGLNKITFDGFDLTKIEMEYVPWLR